MDMFGLFNLKQWSILAHMKRACIEFGKLTA